MEKQDFINDIFSRVAHKYDLMNDLMSFGLHRYWKQKLIANINPINSKILDVASGSGDIALELYKAWPTIFAQKEIAEQNSEITLCDPNLNMIQEARTKFINNNYLENVNFVVSTAEELPFNNDTFDYYTIAFGIRNVSSIERALKESYRVLKPKGIFLCLEFSKVNYPIFQYIYNFYNKLIPPLGNLITGQEKAYRYLVSSISHFPDQVKFAQMIRNSGYQRANFINYTFGLVAIHIGYKAE